MGAGMCRSGERDFSATRLFNPSKNPITMSLLVKFYVVNQHGRLFPVSNVVELPCTCATHSNSSERG